MRNIPLKAVGYTYDIYPKKAVIKLFRSRKEKELKYSNIWKRIKI